MEFSIDVIIQVLVASIGAYCATVSRNGSLPRFRDKLSFFLIGKIGSLTCSLALIQYFSYPEKYSYFVVFIISLIFARIYNEVEWGKLFTRIVERKAGVSDGS